MLLAASESAVTKKPRLREKYREAQDYVRVIRDTAATPEQKDTARKQMAQLRKEIVMEASAWNAKFKEMERVVRPIERRDWVWTGKVNEKLGEWAGKEAGIND